MSSEMVKTAYGQQRRDFRESFRSGNPFLYALCLIGVGVLRFVKSRVKGVEVAAVQMLLNRAESFAETLEMNNFTFPKEADGVADFRVFDDTEDVVVGGAGFLFRRQILEQIRNRISLGLEFTGIERYAACCLRPDTGGVVDIVGAEAGGFDLFRGQIPGQLVDDGCHDF